MPGLLSNGFEIFAHYSAESFIFRGFCAIFSIPLVGEGMLNVAMTPSLKHFFFNFDHRCICKKLKVIMLHCMNKMKAIICNTIQSDRNVKIKI